MKTLLLLIMLAILSGCNASPNQLYGSFSLFTFDNRTYYEVAGNVTNQLKSASRGHGSNSRVYSDVVQGMVLYKSPMTASSNATETAVSVPLVGK